MYDLEFLQNARARKKYPNISFCCCLILFVCSQFNNFKNDRAAIAQLGERQTEDLEVPSSILGLGIFYDHMLFKFHGQWPVYRVYKGLFRESNPGPPAPEAGIIPLDQTADTQLTATQNVSDETVTCTTYGVLIGS